MTTEFTVTPIVEEQAGRTTVDLPSAVGGEPTRADRIIRGVERAGVIAVGDLSVSWIFRGEPPSIGDLVKVRVPDWEPFEKLRHRCFDRTQGGMREIAAGWTCECDPMSDEVRKANTRDIRVVKSIRAAWVVYNHLVGLPATVLLYIAAWIFQHPGRLLLTAILTLIVLGLVFK